MSHNGPPGLIIPFFAHKILNFKVTRAENKIRAKYAPVPAVSGGTYGDVPDDNRDVEKNGIIPILSSHWNGSPGAPAL
jgi:hypothetical protein